MQENLSATRLTRFWAKVDKNGPVMRPELGACWIWTAATYPTGYGMFSVARSLARGAHRISYQLTYGDIPAGLLVCHKCDVRACVRPDHLFLGTHADNSQDAALKGRMPGFTGSPENHGARKHPERFPKGQDSPVARLTNAKVLEIRARLAGGAAKRALAREYGVSDTLIRYIAVGKAWRHLLPHAAASLDLL